MRIPLMLVLITPLVGAVVVPVFGDVPAQRRVFAALCSAVAIGGGVWAFVRAVSGSGVTWNGFTLDPWRGVLVFGALVAAAAALARAEGAERPGVVQSAIFAATAAGIAPLMVPGAHLLAVTLPVATVALGVATFAASEGPVFASRGWRSVAELAASDVLALIALGSAIGDGTALPPALSTLAASLMLAAALIRLGLLPAVGSAAEAGSAGSLWLGPVRAQGFLLAAFAVGGHRSVAYAGAAAAALAILVTGLIASRRGRGSALPALGTGVALLGLALGGPIPTWGAAIAAVAAFAGPAAWTAGGAWSAAARATLAAIPAGGLFAGAALVLGAAFGAGAVEPGYLAFAVPAAAGLVAAGASVWLAPGPSRAGGVASILAGFIGVATTVALAAVPVRATSWLGESVARTLGVGRLLSVGGEHGVAEGLAIVVLGVGLLAFVVGPGSLGMTDRPVRALVPEAALAATSPDVHARRWLLATAFLLAAAIGLAIRVYVESSGRGFL